MASLLFGLARKLVSRADEEKRRVSVGASGYRNIEYQMCTPTTHPKAEPPAATQDAPQVCEPHLLRSQNGGLNQVTSRGATPPPISSTSCRHVCL